MRVRNTFQKQVGEALAIGYELRKSKLLMNSKSEYNRCALPGICTRNQGEYHMEQEEDKEEERILREEIKKL